MWKCEVCGKENTGLLCPRCGFDESCNYEQYPTLAAAISGKAVSQLKKEHNAARTSAPAASLVSVPEIIRKEQASAFYPCSSCGGISFGFKKPDFVPVCLTCGAAADVPGRSARRASFNGCHRITANDEYSVCLREDGTILTTGKSPVADCPVDQWSNIVSVSAGYLHTVALRQDGTVIAAGSNEYGQCNVGNWRDVIAVSAGSWHTVALRKDGKILATGSSFGWRDAVGWTDIVAIGAGWELTVGLRRDGTVVAVGDNEYGQCNVSDWKDITAISVFGLHVVGLRRDGLAEEAGYIDDHGHIGKGAGIWKDLAAVSAGGWHTVGLRRDGTVIAAGNNSYGQCHVTGWTDVVEIYASTYHTIALRSDGTILATGDPEHGRCNVNGMSLL